MIGEDIELATRLDPALGQVRADPGQMEQILMNLAVNARDAMPTGGRLCIETRNVDLAAADLVAQPDLLPGGHVLLTVADTGCGMDEKTKSRIFEPFFTTKEVGKGTGLGLATVYGIVKQSNGGIEVHSEVGRGTSFRIYLPRQLEAPRGRPSDAGRRRFPQGSETILLVEDENEVRRLGLVILQANGYTVLEASNAQEALKIAAAHSGPLHLLVTDVVMPGMSGRQLAEQLLSGRPGLKVLYLSGYADEAVSRYGVLIAGMAFMQKPFTPTSLASKVREVLGASISRS
jgi:two-component system cell cycle sensor histidine kinase/response regulator CckA